MDVKAKTSQNIIDKRAGSYGLTWLIGLFAGIFGHSAAMKGPDPDVALVQLVSTALDRAQDYFGRGVPGWRDAKVVLFKDKLSTPCGAADKTSGPFYCPANERVYLDLAFLKAIDGDLARAYVIAHELGHHAQKISRAQLDAKAAELQADCYAGAWMKQDQLDGHLAPGDVQAALDEADAVGDDRVAPGSPELWTHGTSEERVRAVARGLETQECVR